MDVDVDVNSHAEVMPSNSIVNGNDKSNADRETNGGSNGNGNGGGSGEGVDDWGNATFPFPVKMVSGKLTNPITTLNRISPPSKIFLGGPKVCHQQ